MAKFYTLNANSDVVTNDEVVPKGTGTEVIATIGGKEIKAPAGGGGGSVSSVNGKTGAVVLGAEDVGAVPTEMNQSPKCQWNVPLEVEGESGIVFDGTDDTHGQPSALSVGTGGLWIDAACGHVELLAPKFTTPTFPYGALLELTGKDGKKASIKKDGKEVATEEQVDAVEAKVDDIGESVSVNNRFLVNETTASIQTREDEESEFSDEFSMDKGYDAVRGDAMVKLDKSIQTVTVAGGTLTVVFPDAVDGTVRDLCLYVNNTDSESTVEMTFPDGTYYGADGWDSAAQKGGITGYYFSEIPGNGWRVSREELKQFTKGA